MKLTMLPSDKGDCLLLESRDGKRMLCDGGMRSSFVASVAPQLSELRDLDVVYVSHIDDDHIGGVLKLLQDEMDWKVFDFHQRNGNDEIRRPRVPRPPTIKRFWHNAFHDVMRENAGPVEDLLAAMAPMLSSTDDPELMAIGQGQQNLITSKAQAIEVSQLVAPSQLGIPVNEATEAGDEHRFMMVRDGQQAIPLGSIRLTLIAPFEEDLDKFRDEWNDWLRENKTKVKELREKARRQSDRLTTDVDGLLAPFVFAAPEFGDRKKVTLPNLVSLMFLVEEDEKTLLLTGDGHWADILRGLEQTQKIPVHGDIHVDILKVQHHGSEHNINEEFCRRVSADHYVFCGNGFSGNPEPKVLKLIYNSRFGTEQANLATNAKAAGRKVKFWFNTNSQREQATDRREHMEGLEDMCRQRAAEQPRFSAEFMNTDSLDVQ